jgi:hypothetical protein
LFEVLEGQYFGVALTSTNWGMKILRGNECGAMHTAAS